VDCVEVRCGSLLYNIAGSEDLKDFLVLISPSSTDLIDERGEPGYVI
jgi:hypothetical protein